MPSHSRLDKTLLFAANALIPIAILVFATGFFPYKPFMPGLATWEDVGFGWDGSNASTISNSSTIPHPPAIFDKVVFMVVDALRSDFVYSSSSGFSFIQSLIRTGTAIPFTAHATSPTITMPRIKAITTGSIPSFLDVILNFAESDTSSSLASQDTWLAQLRQKPDGKRLVMYGDDTWLKLFPGFFDREEGTSSFFVADFTEVDDNVTRHVPEELLNADWNGCVLHYLGLDHIGHKAGPNSPNMLPKQREMDAIAETIYTAIEEESHLSSTLFVLAGDHGMNEGGNHGGSAPGETSPALVFMSPKLSSISPQPRLQSPIKPYSGDFDFYTKVEQSDIAPTLAGLLGFPVPLNNLGVFIPEFLGFWGERDRVGLLVRNARQILRIVEATFPGVVFGDDVVVDMKCDGDLSSGEELACLWQGVVRAMTSKEDTEVVLGKLMAFCRTAQSTMSSTASNYDVPRLILGTALSTISLLTTLFVLRRSISTPSPTGIFFTLVLVLYAILMFASSYVEEEQHFWYWVTSLWFGWLFVVDSRKSFPSRIALHPAILLLVLLRTSRRWNQTGQKHAGAPDIAHSSLLTNPIILWSLIGATYLHLTLRLSRHIARSISGLRFVDEDDEPGKRMLGLAAILPVGIVGFVFKLGFTARDAPELVGGLPGEVVSWVEGVGLVGLVRIVFLGVAGGVGWCVCLDWWKRRSGKGESKGEGKGEGGGIDLAVAIFDFLSLFLLTQTRAQNIPIYLVFRVQFFLLSFLNLTPTQISLSTLLLTHTSFFALGNSNAISSIDLSNSYNGVSGYNVFAVGVLVFVSNWAGAVFWGGAGVLLLLGGESGDEMVGRDDVQEAQSEQKSGRGWVEKELQHLVPVSTTTGGSGTDGCFTQHMAILTLFTAGSLAAVMAACTALRTHLFIWTVFSPKFLYAMAWGVAWLVGVGWGVGGGLWWAGSGCA